MLDYSSLHINLCLVRILFGKLSIYTNATYVSVLERFNSDFESVALT